EACGVIRREILLGRRGGDDSWLCEKVLALVRSDSGDRDCRGVPATAAGAVCAGGFGCVLGAGDEDVRRAGNRGGYCEGRKGGADQRVWRAAAGRDGDRGCGHAVWDWLEYEGVYHGGAGHAGG